MTTAAFCLALAALQDPPPLEAGAAAQYVYVGGKARITRGSFGDTATTIRLDEDLDLDPGPAPGAWLRVRPWKRWSLDAEYERLEWRGGTTVDTDFIFHGETYAAGREIDSNLRLEVWRLGGAVHPSERLSIGLGAEYIRFSMQIETDDAGPAIDEHRNFNVLTPFAFAELRSRISAAAGLRSRWLFGTAGAHHFVASAGTWLSWRLGAGAEISLGARLEWIEWSPGTNRGNFVTGGPEIGFVVRF